MKAVGLWNFGGPEVLETIDVVTPQPDETQVQVTVVAATVNPTDALLRSGRQASALKDLYPPYIPGMEFSGFISSVGDPLSDLKIGQPVMGLVNPRRREGGAMNQSLVVPVSSIVSIPEDTSAVNAATIPMNGITALISVQALQLKPGDKILVTGGAGAVGGYAIQIAKHFGLRVITDSSEADQELVRSLGADEVVPRGEGMVAAVARLAPKGVAGAIDGAVYGQKTWDTVSDGAICVSLRGMPANADPRIQHAPLSVTNHVEDSEALKQVAQLFAEGVLTARVAKVLPMSQATEAHELLAVRGLRGRIVLRLDN